nr:MAG TPA: hypothetical protein [Caudoviricetes sp.]
MSKSPCRFFRQGLNSYKRTGDKAMDCIILPIYSHVQKPLPFFPAGA